MRQRANARAAEGESAILLDQQRLVDLSDCTPEAEAGARATVADAEEAAH